MISTVLIYLARLSQTRFVAQMLPSLPTLPPIGGRRHNGINTSGLQRNIHQQGWGTLASARARPACQEVP
jgi:hypothetical protein